MAETLGALHATRSRWADPVATFVITAVAVTLLLAGFVFAVDPYGTRASFERGASPIMDNNQRHMYPQIARSRRYDSVVFGTSTVRLLDPKRLDDLFSGHFANLAMNGGTPWEELQLAELFLRHTPAPKTVIWGIDPPWCEPDADRRRTTQFSFPAWLYDENRFNDIPGHLNLRTLQMAGRVVLSKWGLMQERIRSDGYERFVPPDSDYDLARARDRIQVLRHPSWGTAQSAQNEVAARTEMPALNWLEDVLSRLPDLTTTIIIFPPVHVSAQPAPGTLSSDIEVDCKKRVAEIGKRWRAAVLDFRIPSAVTREDSNYWDALHYRVAIAERLAASLKVATESEGPARDGFFRILSTGR